MTNTFWISGNIIFDLSTGAATQVLMLVNRENDATKFQTEKEAQNYLDLVKARAEFMQWFLDPPTPQRPQGWVIRGLQTLPPVR